MPKRLENLVHRWFEEVWNKGREDAIDEILAKDCLVHGLVDEHGNELRGSEHFKAFHRNMRSAFPDVRIKVEETIEDDDLIAARCVVTAVHAGPGIGIEATNKPVKFTGMTMTRWKDGKIVEAWNNFDFHVMRDQLG